MSNSDANKACTITVVIFFTPESLTPSGSYYNTYVTVHLTARNKVAKSPLCVI